MDYAGKKLKTSLQLNTESFFLLMVAKINTQQQIGRFSGGVIKSMPKIAALNVRTIKNTTNWIESLLSQFPHQCDVVQTMTFINKSKYCHHMNHIMNYGNRIDHHRCYTPFPLNSSTPWRYHHRFGIVIYSGRFHCASLFLVDRLMYRLDAW